MRLGAGREQVGDVIDLGAGIIVLKKPGTAVAAGDPVLELHYNDDRQLADAVRLAESAIEVGSTPPPAHPLVIEHVT